MDEAFYTSPKADELSLEKILAAFHQFYFIFVIVVEKDCFYCLLSSINPESSFQTKG